MHVGPALAAALLSVGLPAPAQAASADDPREQRLPVPVTATVTTDQLGPGSVLAVVTRGSFETRRAEGLARSLEVITADGVRRPVYSVDVRENSVGWHPGDFTLADWRPDLHTALLRVSLGPDGDKLVAYDVTTGATREVAAPRRASTVGLAPDGTGILMTTYRRVESRPARAGVLGWDGGTRMLPARGDGPAITSTDGRTLVTAHDRQWWVSDLATGSTTAVDTRGHCAPRRWLDPDTVVASCTTRRWGQLRAVDLDGTSHRIGVRHRMEPDRDAGPLVFADGDARVVQGRTWFESYDGCGGGFLTRQTPAGEVRRVRVPGRDGTVTLVGTRDDRLVLALQRTECGAEPDRAVLSAFDPVTRDETVLTRLGRRESWREVVDATEVHSWRW